MMKKLLCLFLALSLCFVLTLCFVSCDKEPTEEPGTEDPGETPDAEENGEKKGEIYYTPDPGGNVSIPETNKQPTTGGTIRY